MLHRALRMIRVFHDLSQKDLASRLGIAPSYLSEVEAGKKEPTLSLLRKYSEEFAMPLSSIMFFAEHVGDGPSSDKIRSSVSNKVLKLLEFIAARAGRDAA
jgi:transcriptional regulator with XRE-family HTH domain